VSDKPVPVDAMPVAMAEGDAVTVPEELLPKRGPGRPAGSKNKDRVSSIERINREGDPLGFRLKALKRGYVMAAPTEGAKVREKIYLTADEMLRLAGALEDKILPRLRSIEVTGDGIGNTNTLINVMDSLDERTLKNLITVLQPQAAAHQAQLPNAIEHEPADTNVAHLRPPGWRST
jgi:hypothetical protein